MNPYIVMNTTSNNPVFVPIVKPSVSVKPSPKSVSQPIVTVELPIKFTFAPILALFVFMDELMLTHHELALP